MKYFIKFYRKIVKVLNTSQNNLTFEYIIDRNKKLNMFERIRKSIP